ncbi:branched-chain amino acid ABC transporter permease [Cupriavidus plantarum]|uniref:Amino acid/amide ABC transporter membrane protein 2 (HAAT family) n=1 Tax=Cupriavidus plantarum TaxID=942865 RepID=A0A316EU89_9BURK|nr:branched-chain amino acid ABC transporter permease [Cupriavidus plantarum]PWK34317.1 amino acid/amide ABC transporter membrane protein 2 (HAAT family) [Cupriavidus plantarum]
MMDFLLAYENVIALVCINAILGIGVYLMLSVNRFSLATGGLVAVGAYVSVLVSLHTALPFPAALAAGTLAGALMALLLGAPVLRLEGDYFALATLAFTEVMRVIAFNWDTVTGGALGLDGIPLATTLPLLAATVAALVAVIVIARRGRTGRVLEATRLDDMPAQALGIDVARVRLAVFVFSGAVCGLGGALLGHLNGFIGPNDFGLQRSLDAIAYAVLGGLGHVSGALAGATIFTALPEALRFSAQAREIVMATILLLAVVFLPRGMLSIGQPLRGALGRISGSTRRAAPAGEAAPINTEVRP